MKSLVRYSTYSSIAWIIILLPILLGGCALQPPPDSADTEDTTQFTDMTTVDAIQKIEVALHNAQQQDTQFFAPKHFSTANKTLNEARQLLKQNASRNQIIQKTAVAKAVIKNAEKVKKNIQFMLGNELNLKHNLEANNAHNIYAQEYGSLISRLEKIIVNIENGKQEQTLPDRTALIEDLQKLELRTIVYTALHESEEILQRIKYRNAEKFIPFTFKDTSDVLQRAKTFIISNPHNQEAIDQISQEALFATKRALYLINEVAALSHKTEVSLEQVVLEEEYRLMRIARALNTKDVRNNSLEVQSEIIAKSAADLAARDNKLEQLSEALTQSLTQLKETNKQLILSRQTVYELETQRNTWLAKEALFTAKVNQLKSANSEHQDKIINLLQQPTKIQSNNNNSQNKSPTQPTSNLNQTTITQSKVDIPPRPNLIENNDIAQSNIYEYELTQISVIPQKDIPYPLQRPLDITLAKPKIQKIEFPLRIQPQTIESYGIVSFDLPATTSEPAQYSSSTIDDDDDIAHFNLDDTNLDF